MTMTKKKLDPRSAIKKAKDAAYAKLPAAIIFKPLRFIRDNTPRVNIKDPLGNIVGYDDSVEYKAALRSAKFGAGASVQADARRLHLAMA